MKISLMIKSPLFIFLLFLSVHLNVNASSLNSEDICLSFTQQGSELYNECIKRYEKSKHIDHWESVNSHMDMIQLTSFLEEELNDLGLEKAKKKKYLKNFLVNVNEIVTNISSENEKQWGNSYIEKIQAFSDVQTLLQNFMDEKQQLYTAIDTLGSQKKRLHSLTEVFLQQLSGIPTRYLILGKSKWDTANEIGYQVDNHIANQAASFINSELIGGLIFSNTEIKNAKIVKSVVRNLKSIQVEEHGADPKSEVYEDERYLLQIYRCYPRYDIDFKQETSPSKNQNTLISVVPKFWHINRVFLEEEANAGIFNKTPDLLDEAHTLITDVEKDNKTNIEKILDFEKRYSLSLQVIENKKNETIKKLWDMTNLLTKRIYYDLQTDMNMQEIRRQLSRPVNKLENLSFDKIHKVDELKTQIEDYLATVYLKINKLKKEKEKDILNLIQQKRMIVFTIKSKNIGPFDEHPKKEAIKLLQGVMKTLDQRKKQFQSYELSIVEDGKLVSSQVSKFYNEGYPVRYIIYPPVLYHPIPSILRLSIFLALEVEYTKKSEKKYCIYDDSSKGVSWFIDNAECYSYDTAINRLPNNFKFLSKKDVVSFKDFMNKNKHIKKKHQYLFSSGNEIWTIEEDWLTRKIFTYDLVLDKLNRHSKSFCAFGLGIK